MGLLAFLKVKSLEYFAVHVVWHFLPYNFNAITTCSN